MNRLMCFAFIVLACSAATVADDALDTAKTSLESAKKSYDTTVAKAKNDLQMAATREMKRLRMNKKKDINEQLARIEVLETQLKEFEKKGVLPAVDELGEAVTAYKESVRKARLKCEKAFDTMAQRFVTEMDDENAKRILKQKQQYFLRKIEPGAFQVTTKPPFGRAVVDLNPDGTFKQDQDEKYSTTGTWEQTTDEEVILTFENPQYGTVTLAITDNDHLTGPNVNSQGHEWTWRMTRLSAVTFPPGAFLSTTVPDEGEWTWTLKSDGTHSNQKGDVIYTGTWEQIGDEIVFHFARSNYVDNETSTGRLKIIDNDHLTGSHVTTNGQAWKWTVVRKAPDQPPP